jgi:O-antigen ligase
MNKESRLKQFSEKLAEWLPLVLLAAIVGFIPFVVYLKIVTYEGIAHQVYGRTQNVDFFTYYRALWLYILTGTSLVYFLLNNKKETNVYHWFFGVYAFFVIVSTVFARYPAMAEWGDPCRHEGMWTHLCYMTIAFLAMNLVKNLKQAKFLLFVLVVASSVLAAIGILQFTGHDYFFGSFTPEWLVPDYLNKAGVASVLVGQSQNAGSIFLTFGNGNFTGSYMAMLFCLSSVLALFAEGRIRHITIPWNVALFVNLLGSKSRAGLLAAILSVLVIAFFMRKDIKKNWVTLILIVIVYIACLGFLEIYTVGSKRPGFIQTSVGRSASAPTSFFGNFEDVKLRGKEADVVFDGIKLTVRFNEEKIEFYDGQGEKVDYQLIAKSSVSKESVEIASHSAERLSDSLAKDEVVSFGFNKKNVVTDYTKLPELAKVTSLQSFSIEEEKAESGLNPEDEYLVVFPENKFRGFAILARPSMNLLNISRGGGGIYLVYTENGFRILDGSGRVKSIEYAPAIGFKGRERFASGRGYIWSRTLPLLKKTWFVGYGPDTFAAHFPHYDCVERLKHWGSMQIIMEKPHNLYLQIAFNSGIISLLAILGLFFTYFRQSFKLYFYSTFESFLEKAGLAVMAAVLAYLVAGFFNDSVNSVAPVFWGLVGLGIAINRIVEKKNGEPAKELDN